MGLGLAGSSPQKASVTDRLEHGRVGQLETPELALRPASPTLRGERSSFPRLALDDKATKARIRNGPHCA